MRTGSTDRSPRLKGLQTQLTRRDQECRDERSLALQLGAQHSEVEAFARTLAAENRQHEYARAELRTLPVNVVGLSESSAAQSSPPQGGASASGVQGPGHSWNSTLPNPREIPEQLQSILGRTQKFNIGDPVETRAPGAEGSTAEQSETAEPTKLKEATELLAEALKSVIKKPDDGDKPRSRRLRL